MRRPIVTILCLLTACWLGAQIWLLAPAASAWGQDKSKSKASKKKGNSAVLDVKANELQGSFVKSAEELASEYYELKEYDKARVLLKSIQALDPDRAGLAAKLKLLDEEMIGSNETEVEVNTAKGWESAGVLAFNGKPIRIKAEGAYKFVISSQLGPTGFAASKVANPNDLVRDVPFGGLMGVIVSPPRAQGDNRTEDQKRKDADKQKPFFIGEGCDYTPQGDGVLYLRVNAPAENKNTGKIKVTVSGGAKLGK
jgi:hypothetical protein